MTILLSLDFPPDRGGIQRHLFDTVRFTYRAGDRVIAVVSARADDGPERPLPCAVRRIAVPRLLNRKALTVPLLAALAAGAAAASRRVRFECGNVYAACAAWAVTRIFRRPYAVYAYGTELLGLQGTGWKARLLRHVMRRASTVHALGEFTQRLVREAGILAAVEIRPPRIALADYPGTGLKLAPADGECRILSVGRLVGHKGHRILVDAVSGLPEHILWRLVIIGSGPLEQALRRQAAALGIAGRVDIVTGCGDDALREYYRAATVFVLPSLALPGGVEGFGIVILEAMAYGVPVIASDTGGVGEVLDGGTAGTLVPPGDSAALRAALAGHLADPDLRMERARRGYEHLRANYVWNT